MTAPAAQARRWPFLTTRWESLVLLNSPCRREWLEPLVPSGTELDPWQGDSLVSPVGFLFTDTGPSVSPFPFTAPGNARPHLERAPGVGLATSPNTLQPRSDDGRSRG
jgi:uncharacterized protein YqjF (DUF2071 family)